MGSFMKTLMLFTLLSRMCSAAGCGSDESSAECRKEARDADELAWPEKSEVEGWWDVDEDDMRQIQATCEEDGNYKDGLPDDRTTMMQVNEDEKVLKATCEEDGNCKDGLPDDRTTMLQVNKDEKVLKAQDAEEAGLGATPPTVDAQGRPYSETPWPDVDGKDSASGATETDVQQNCQNIGTTYVENANARSAAERDKTGIGWDKDCDQNSHEFFCSDGTIGQPSFSKEVECQIRQQQKFFDSASIAVTSEEKDADEAADERKKKDAKEKDANEAAEFANKRGFGDLAEEKAKEAALQELLTEDEKADLKRQRQAQWGVESCTDLGAGIALTFCGPELGDELNKCVKLSQYRQCRSANNAAGAWYRDAIKAPGIRKQTMIDIIGEMTNSIAEQREGNIKEKGGADMDEEITKMKANLCLCGPEDFEDGKFQDLKDEVGDALVEWKTTKAPQALSKVLWDQVGPILKGVAKAGASAALEAALTGLKAGGEDALDVGAALSAGLAATGEKLETMVELEATSVLLGLKLLLWWVERMNTERGLAIDATRDVPKGVQPCATGWTRFFKEAIDVQIETLGVDGTAMFWRETKKCMWNPGKDSGLFGKGYVKVKVLPAGTWSGDTSFWTIISNKVEIAYQQYDICQKCQIAHGDHGVAASYIERWKNLTAEEQKDKQDARCRGNVAKPNEPCYGMGQCANHFFCRDNKCADVFKSALTRPKLLPTSCDDDKLNANPLNVDYFKDNFPCTQKGKKEAPYTSFEDSKAFMGSMNKMSTCAIQKVSQNEMMKEFIIDIVNKGLLPSFADSMNEKLKDQIEKLKDAITPAPTMKEVSKSLLSKVGFLGDKKRQEAVVAKLSGYATKYGKVKTLFGTFGVELPSIWDKA